MAQVLQFFSAVTGYSDYSQRESEARADIIAKIRDVVRCSLITENLEQIPRVLKSLIKVARRNAWMFSIKNSWDGQNASSLGYTSIHVTILITLPGNKRIHVEVQIHPKAIMDGTEKCAKQVTHRLYKLPEEDGEENVPLDLQSCSQLVYLTAITTLSYTETERQEVNKRLNALKAYQKMTEEKKKERVILATAMLLTDDPDKFGTGNKWSKKYNAFVPRNREAVANALREEKIKINAKLYQLGLAECFEGASNPATMTNTATSLKELMQDAEKVAPIFNRICNAIVHGHRGCLVSLGPRQRHMIKELPSLEHKINKIRQQQLRQEGRLPLRCLTWARSPKLIKTAVVGSLLMGAGGVAMMANNFRQDCSRAVQLKETCLTNLTAARNGHALMDDFFGNVTQTVSMFRKDPDPEIQSIFPMSQLSLAQINASTEVVTVWPTKAVECLRALKACDKLKENSKALHLTCLENLAATRNETIKAQNDTMQEKDKCRNEVVGAKDQTIDAKDQTIDAKEHCSVLLAPLQLRVGACDKLEDTQNENSRLIGVEKQCIADVIQCSADIKARDKDIKDREKDIKDREKERDKYKDLYDESQKIFPRRWLGI